MNDLLESLQADFLAAAITYADFINIRLILDKAERKQNYMAATDTNKAYNPFSPPPEGFVSEWGDQVLAKHKKDALPYVREASAIRRNWDLFEWAIPIPSAPVRPKRYSVDVDRTKHVLDNETGYTFGPFPSPAHAEAVAELLERMEDNG